MKLARFPALCLLVIALAVPAAARADDDGDHELARALSAEGRILSLQQILEKASAHQKGTIIEAEFERDGTRFIYELEIVDEEGVVWELKLDAASGDLISMERD